MPAHPDLNQQRDFSKPGHMAGFVGFQVRLGSLQQLSLRRLEASTDLSLEILQNRGHRGMSTTCEYFSLPSPDDVSTFDGRLQVVIFRTGHMPATGS